MKTTATLPAAAPAAVTLPATGATAAGAATAAPCHLAAALAPLALSAALLLAGAVFPLTVRAQVNAFEVTSGTDTAAGNTIAGSLRQAISTGTAGIAVGGTITFSSALDSDPIIMLRQIQFTGSHATPISIIGNPGADADDDPATVLHADRHRIFHVTVASPMTEITLSNLVLTNALSATNAGPGGALYFQNTDPITINTGAGGALVFRGNENPLAGGGGAIGFTTSLTFTGSASFIKFDQNLASVGRGGAISAAAGATLLEFSSPTTHVLFTSNTAVTDGGAIWLPKGSTLFKGPATFTGNISQTKSGGAIIAGANIEISGSSRFENNSAGSTGGAIFWWFDPNNAPTSLTFSPTMTLNANTGDIIFRGNIHTTTTSPAPNAIYYSVAHATAVPGAVFDFRAAAGNTIAFYDPINGTNGTKPESAVTLTKTGAGTVLFDTHASDIVVTATVAEGVFQLSNEATFGKSGSGSFTLAAGATLAGNGTLYARDFTAAAGATFEARDNGFLSVVTTNPAIAAGVNLAGAGKISTGTSLTTPLLKVGQTFLSVPADTVSAPAAPADTAQTLALADDITLAAGGTLALGLFAGNASDRLAFDGAFTLAGAAVLEIDTIASGAFTLATWDGAGPAASATSAITVTHDGAALSARNDASITIGTGSLTLVNTFKNLALAWTGAAGDDWKNSPSEAANWTDGSAATIERNFINGDAVAFTAAAGENRAIALDAAGVTVASMTVAGDGGHTFAGAGGITATRNAADILAGSTVDATGKLAKSGPGPLTFANTGANTFAGGVEITGGRVAFATGAQLAATGTAITIDNTAAQDAALAGAGTLSAARVVAKNGGLLDIGASSATAATLAIDGDLELDGGIVRFDLLGENTHDFLSVLGDLNLAATGTIDIGMFQIGTFTIADAANLASVNLNNLAVTIGGGTGARQTGVLSVSDTTLVLQTMAGESFRSTWDGSGTTWGGGAHISGTEFATGDAMSFTDAHGDQTVAVASGGVIVSELNVTGAADYTFTGGAITVSASSAITPDFAPTGKLTKTGTGTLAFENTGANRFDGGIEIDAGAIAFQNAAQIGTGTVAGAGAAITFAGTGTLRVAGSGQDAGTVAAAVVIGANQTALIDTQDNALALAGAVAGGDDSTLAKTGAGLLALTGSNTHARTALAGGTLALGHAAAAGAALRIDESDTVVRLDTGGDFAALTRLDLGAHFATLDTQANDAVFSATLTAAATGTLAKAGAGALTLKGDSGAAFAGALDITAGSVLLDGGVIGGAVHVRDGAVFGGVGAAGGDSGVAGGAASVHIHDGARIQIGDTTGAGAGSGGGSSGGGGELFIANLVFEAGGTGAIGGTGTLSGAGSIGAGATVNVTVNAAVGAAVGADAGPLVISSSFTVPAGAGEIAAHGSVFNKNGAGALVIDGHVAAGAFNLDEGELHLMRADDAVALTAGTLNLAAGAALRGWGRVAAGVTGAGDIHIGRAARPDAPSRVLTVDGDYAGAGGTVYLTIGTENGAIVSDRLAIAGAAGGAITLHFTTDGGVLPANEILWAVDSARPLTVAGNPGAGADVWSVTSNTIDDTDGFQHSFIRDAAHLDGGWTNSLGDEVPALTGADAAAMLAGKASFASLTRRLALARLGGEPPRGASLWLDGFRRRDNLRAFTYDGASVATRGLAGATATTQGVQVGGGWSAGLGDDRTLSLGAFADYARLEMDQAGKTSSTVTEASAFGLYGAFRAGGWWLDGIARFAQEKHTVSVPLRPDFSADGDSLAVAVETGWIIADRGGWFLEPQLAAAWHRHGIDDATDSLGRVYRFDGMDSIEARGGLRMWTDSVWFEKLPVTFWLRGSYLFDLKGESTVRVGRHAFGADLGGSSALFDAGLVMRLARRLTLDFDAAWHYGNVYSGYTLDLGVGYNW
jgi:autotransporter-associated beta strand protein